MELIHLLMLKAYLRLDELNAVPDSRSFLGDFLIQCIDFILNGLMQCFDLFLPLVDPLLDFCPLIAVKPGAKYTNPAYQQYKPRSRSSNTKQRKLVESLKNYFSAFRS